MYCIVCKNQICPELVYSPKRVHDARWLRSVPRVITDVPATVVCFTHAYLVDTHHLDIFNMSATRPEFNSTRKRNQCFTVVSDNMHCVFVRYSSFITTLSVEWDWLSWDQISSRECISCIQGPRMNLYPLDG